VITFPIPASGTEGGHGEDYESDGRNKDDAMFQQ
jgi:hypothetical protein